ncbi:hypothetical protein DSL68_14060 [Staphylococcus xylosus]|nr:hypothetical protein [Staphylococcus xylosus]
MKTVAVLDAVFHSVLTPGQLSDKHGPVRWGTGQKATKERDGHETFSRAGHGSGFLGQAVPHGLAEERQ